MEEATAVQLYAHVCQATQGVSPTISLMDLSSPLENWWQNTKIRNHVPECNSHLTFKPIFPLPHSIVAFDQDDFPDFVNAVNESLNDVELEIRRAQDELTGDAVLALV